MIVKVPFHLPPDFLSSFGYKGGRRFVALYWGPGDEACFDDGVSSACGSCDNWLYLGFIRQPEVRHWLDENGINLGNSDEQAKHWLVVDSQVGDLFTVPYCEAFRLLRLQRLPD